MKMRLFLSAILLPGLAVAGIWPDAIGPFHRASTSQPALSDRPLWDEYGLKDSETAAYEDGSRKFSATAWRMQDTTAALAAFDWQRAATAVPSKLAALAAETPESLLLIHGNYLLSFTGYKPAAVELAAVLDGLKNVEGTVLPILASYLPAHDLRPNSERYITGPVGLQRFGPAIPPSVAAFHLGAEAQTGVFHSPKGDVPLAIFGYPTPQIAMQLMPGFEKLPGAVVKRSGPLVAVTLSPTDPDFAERLLGEVRYQAEVTRDEYVPTRRDNIGDLVINAFELIGILLVFCVVSGLAFGGVRAFLLHGKTGDELTGMISLHLE